MDKKIKIIFGLVIAYFVVLNAFLVITEIRFRSINGILLDTTTVIGTTTVPVAGIATMSIEAYKYLYNGVSSGKLPDPSTFTK